MKKALSERIGLIDEVRGFAILCMVVYHAVYDAVALFSFDFPFFFSPVMSWVRDLFAFGFIFISGASSRFSRSNGKRGAVCFGLGLGMSLVTLLIMPEQWIAFGILHCLGICMLLHPLLSRGLDRLPTWLGVGGLILLCLLTWELSYGHLGIEGLLSVELPRALYQTDWLFPLGLPSNDFFSADYFPLFPWLFAFLLGSYFGRWLKTGKVPAWVKGTHLRPLAFIGRHTLWIYLLHQPILYGIAIMIQSIM